MTSKARHEVLIVSDSDIVVDRDDLKKLLRSGPARCGAGDLSLPRRSRERHMVTPCRWRNRLSLTPERAGRREAGPRGTLLWIHDRPQDEELSMIGGFKSVVEQLADDYALGALVRRAGLAVAIPSFTVGHVCTQHTALELFRQECAGHEPSDL